MNNQIDRVAFEPRKKRLKLLMGLMLIFMVAAPLLAPIIYADEFAHLHGAGLYFFYISTPAVFGGLFVFNWVVYGRVVKKFEEKE